MISLRCSHQTERSFQDSIHFVVFEVVLITVVCKSQAEVLDPTIPVIIINAIRCLKTTVL